MFKKYIIFEPLLILISYVKLSIDGDSAKGCLTQFWELFPWFLGRQNISNVDNVEIRGTRVFRYKIK